jgi:hypothetical protein
MPPETAGMGDFHAETGYLMKPLFKILLFLLIFSLTFWLMRTADYGKLVLIDLRDLGGIPWLYSAICLIFSILAAFTIQKEWENWNELVAAIKGEVDAVRELWLWTRALSIEDRNRISNCLENYLTINLTEWSAMKYGEISEACGEACDALRKTIVELKEETERSQLLHLFNELIRNRNKKFDQSENRIPHILKNTLIFTDILVIVLSLFIGVRNPFIDYVFTISIGVLAYTIYIVIDDLDNPFRPGSWHLTSHDYNTLLDKIRNDHPGFSATTNVSAIR